MEDVDGWIRNIEINEESLPELLTKKNTNERDSSAEQLNMGPVSFKN